MRRIPLAMLEETVRVATRDQLTLWTDFGKQENLTLETIWRGGLAVFELYIASERPSDTVLMEVSGHACSGELAQMQIFEETIKSLSRRQRSA
jgi:hypothetical protein